MRIFGLSVYRKSDLDELCEAYRRDGYIAGRTGVLIALGFKDWVQEAPPKYSTIEITRGYWYHITQAHSSKMPPETNIAGLLWRKYKA